MKSNTDDYMDSRPPKRICQEVVACPDNNCKQIYFHSMRQSSYRHSRKNLPKHPENIAELHEIWSNLEIQVSKGDTFLLHNDEKTGIVIASAGSFSV